MPPKSKKDSGSPLGEKHYQLAWLMLVVVMMLWALTAYLGADERAVEIPYSEFKWMIRQEMFEEVTLGPATVRGSAKAGTGEPPKAYEAVRPEDPDLLRELEARNIRYRVEAHNPWMLYLLSWVVPILLLFFLWRFFIGGVGGSSAISWPSGAAKRKST